MSEIAPAYEGLDILDDELIRSIIKDAYAGIPAEEAAANELFNMFNVQQVIDACKESDIPSPWSNAVVNKLSEYQREEDNEETTV
jgi:hypothetical protein